VFPPLVKYDGKPVKHLLVVHERDAQSFVVYVQDKAENWTECNSQEMSPDDFQNYLRLLKVHESFVDTAMSRAWDDKYIEIWITEKGEPLFNPVTQEDFYRTVGEELPISFFGQGRARDVEVFKPLEGAAGKWWDRNRWGGGGLFR
jgi:hypothetical protein